MVSAKNSKQASLYPLPPSLTYAVSFVHWQQQVWTGMEKREFYTWNLFLQLDKRFLKVWGGNFFFSLSEMQ